MDKITINTLQEKLVTEKTSLEKQLANFAKKDPEIKDNWNTKYPSKERGSKEEEADEAGEYENLLSLEQNLEMRLKDINMALEKITKNIYGICEKCGKEINEARLMVCPEARFCMNCNR